MRLQQGFLVYDTKNDRYYIDYKKTLSIVVNELLLELLLKNRHYFKGKLLDLGCGKRPYTLIYNQQVDCSIGTEVSFSPHGINEADIVCLAEHVPFRNQQFDTILCTEVLEHTRQPFQVMQEISRLLKPGGHLVLSVPFIYPIHEAPHDHWRFTRYGLERICHESGLEVLRIYTKGGIFVTILILIHHVVVRAINLVSNILHLEPPLYDRPALRWFICQPQWWYLHISRWLRQQASDLLLPLNRTISYQLQRPQALDEVNEWMTCGYLVVARKPLEHSYYEDQATTP
ncbi:MAG: type 11 methyltransferase [Chloroflexus sp.]|nr:MAG: type 11 methyltransferase [Chloroflexus sp.]